MAIDPQQEKLDETFSSENVMRESMRAIHATGQAAQEVLGPPLQKVFTVLDYPMNLVRGAAAGKLDEAFERTVSAREIPMLLPRIDDSHDMRVLKKMVGTGLDFVGPGIIGTGLVKGGRYVLKGIPNHKLWVERKLEDIGNGTIPRLRREIEKRFPKLNAEQIRGSFRITQQQAAVNRYDEAVKRTPVSDPDIRASRTKLDEGEAAEITPTSATDKFLADDLAELTEARRNQLEAFIDEHGARALADENYIIPPEAVDELFEIFEQSGMLEAAKRMGGHGMGAGLQRFDALQEVFREGMISGNLKRLLKNYRAEDVVRMAAIYKLENKGKNATDFLTPPLEKPGLSGWMLETYLGNILGPASAISASLTTQGWMYLKALDVATANSKIFRTMFGHGLEAERAAMDGRALMMGYVDGAIDIMRMGVFHAMKKTQSFLDGQNILPTSVTGFIDSLTIDTAITQRWRSLDRFHEAQKAKFGMRRDIVKADNLSDRMPGRENEWFKGLINLWGATNRFWPKSIAYLDTGARYQMLRGNLYRAYHRYKDTSPTLFKKSKQEALDFIEKNPKDFKIMDLETGEMRLYTEVAETMADAATMSQPIDGAQAIFKSPLFRIAFSPYPDVAVRSVERVAERLPFLNKLTPLGRNLSAQGGNAEMLRRAGMANAAMMGGVGLLLHNAGNLAGSGPVDPDLRDSYELDMGMPVQSLTIGDINFALNRIQPFGTFFTFYADIYDKIQWFPEEQQEDLWNAGVQVAAEFIYATMVTTGEHLIDSTPVADVANTYRLLRSLSADRLGSHAWRKGAKTLVDVAPILPTGTLRWLENMNRPNKVARQKFDGFLDALDAEAAKLGIFGRNSEVRNGFPEQLAKDSGLTHASQHTKQLPVGINPLGYAQATSGNFGEGAYLPSFIRRIPKTLSAEQREKAKTVNTELIRLSIDLSALDPTLGLSDIQLPTEDLMLLRALRGHKTTKVRHAWDEQGNRMDLSLLDLLHWVITKDPTYQQLRQPLTQSQQRERTDEGKTIGIPKDYMSGDYRISGPDRRKYIQSVFAAFNNKLEELPFVHNLRMQVEGFAETNRQSANRSQIHSTGGQQ